MSTKPRKAKRRYRRSKKSYFKQMLRRGKSAISAGIRGFKATLSWFRGRNWAFVNTFLLCYLILSTEALHAKLDWLAEAWRNSFVTIFLNLIAFSDKIDWLLQLFTGTGS